MVAQKAFSEGAKEDLSDVLKHLVQTVTDFLLPSPKSNSNF